MSNSTIAAACGGHHARYGIIDVDVAAVVEAGRLVSWRSCRIIEAIRFGPSTRCGSWAGCSCCTRFRRRRSRAAPRCRTDIELIKRRLTRAIEISQAME